MASLRERKKARTAATIAGAALDLFAERGFASVTIADVAAAAGVGERTVYRYFPDKEELLFAEDPGWRDACAWRWPRAQPTSGPTRPCWPPRSPSPVR